MPLRTIQKEAKKPAKSGKTLESQAKKPRRKKVPAAERFTFGYLVHDVSRTRRTLVDQLMKPLNVTRSQWSVLSMLTRGGPEGMLQVDLARLLDVGKVTVGGLVDRLSASGHVERVPDPVDRRAKRVRITDMGNEIIAQLIEVSRNINARILNDVSSEDLDITERVLLQVKTNIRDMLQET